MKKGQKLGSIFTDRNKLYSILQRPRSFVTYMYHPERTKTYVFVMAHEQAITSN